jgi:hypothetical protein
MADLPYTNGSNGNGLTSALDLIKYVVKYPLALYDQRFMMSYIPLINSCPNEKKRLLNIVDKHEGMLPHLFWVTQLRV